MTQTNAQRLAEYEVIVLFDASSSVTVMAESPEEAAGKAEELTSGNQQLCHQCSNTLETGDAIGCIVYKDDELVAETDWKSQRLTDLETANAQLRAVICQCLAALKNGSGASPECSLEFLAHAPEEVGAVVDQLRAELEAVRRDAERYRWLREQHWVEPEAKFRLSLSDTDDSAQYEREIDAAIDAAQAERAKGE